MAWCRLSKPTHKQYDALFSSYVLSVNVSVPQKPIYVAIPYHSARAFAVREAVIKAETADGHWTVLDSAEVTFDNLNYKVRHIQRTNPHPAHLTWPPIHLLLIVHCGMRHCLAAFFSSTTLNYLPELAA